MTIPEAYKNKYFFHFTHISNLEDILKGGLLSTNEKEQRKVKHLNVASRDIQCTRHEMQVECGYGGYVHDYVPFYFCSRTPMFLSIIKSRNFDQPFFIHFAVSIDNLNDAEFIFTNKAANRKFELPDFYECPSNLSKLNWQQIESRSWGVSDSSLKHQKMAEALHYKEFEISKIDYIVVWNDSYRVEVQRLFKMYGKKCPPIYFDGQYGYYHYYTDLNYSVNNSLVHGPVITKRTFENLVKSVIDNRKVVREEYLFDDIESCLQKIKADFCCIRELKGISNLPTNNFVHKDNVEEHTKRVVRELVTSEEYKSLSDQEKLVAEISAYMHDVGKGPKGRWTDGVQKVDDDHPRKSAKYIARFLVEDVDTISKNDIRQILLAVMYHDFMGDHLVSGRYLTELKGVLKSQSDLKVLYALCKADVLAIHAPWYTERTSEWENAYKTIEGFIND